MTTNQAKFTHGHDEGNGVNRGHQFTIGELAEVYGWRGARPTHTRMGLAKAEPPGAGNLGQIDSFIDGLRDGRDRRAVTALAMAGAYVGIRGLQHWRRHQRAARP